MKGATLIHRVAAYLFFAVVYAYLKNYTMFDDGLRHIAFAAYPEVMKSWGDVYPHSLFGSYDPWFAWHAIVEFLLFFAPYESVHILINAIFLFFVALWCDLAIRKFVSRDLGAVTVLAAITIAYLSGRYLNARPDNISGLYVMYALLLPNRFLPSFALALLYAPTYYLFYFYTGTVGLVWLLTKNYRSFAGVFAASIIGLLLHLAFGGAEFVEISSFLLSDQKLREGLNVGELVATFAPLELLPNALNSVVLLAAGVWVVYRLEQKSAKPPIVYFLILSSFMWLQALRYYELFYPLIFVSAWYLAQHSDFSKIKPNILKAYAFCKNTLLQAKDSLLFLGGATLITVVGFSLAGGGENESKKIMERYSFLATNEYSNKTVLTNAMTNMQYFGLYQNPTLHFVPSCSIGWFDKSDPKMRDIYIRMQKEKGVSEEEIAALASYVKADYYVHYMRNVEQKLDFTKLKTLGFEPIEIRSNTIVFRVLNGV